MDTIEKKLKEEETELLEENTEENTEEYNKKLLELKKKSGLGCLRGKIHYDDSVWGFYGN